MEEFDVFGQVILPRFGGGFFTSRVSFSLDFFLRTSQVPNEVFLPSFFTLPTFLFYKDLTFSEEYVVFSAFP